MSTELVNPVSGEVIEKVIVNADLKNLSSAERVAYYKAVCESVGLNPLTQPFGYLTLNNKLTLYALKSCTDQLRRINRVSVTEISAKESNGLYVVTCQVRDEDGRTDASTGAVSVAGLRGDVLANAIMKAETKAKRRATLSICGLSLLDESEVDSIPNAHAGHVNVSGEIPQGGQAPASAPSGPSPKTPEEKAEWFRREIPLAHHGAKLLQTGELIRTPEQQLQYLRDGLGKQAFVEEVAKELGALWFKEAFAMATSQDVLQALWDQVEKQGFTADVLDDLGKAHDAKWDTFGPPEEPPRPPIAETPATTEERDPWF